MEEEPFNPDYVEVDRVLEVSYCEDKDTGEVKWTLFWFVNYIREQASVCFICVCVPEHVLLFFSFFFLWLSIPFQYIHHSSDVFVSPKCPRPS